MHEFIGKGWKHPGRRASDYGRSDSFDHDERIYASAVDYSGLGPKGYQRSDERIKEDVCETLFWDPDVDASEIDVEVKDNFVFLSGRVDSRHAKKRAGRVVEDITGVKDIYNRLTIKPFLDYQSDKIIARGEDGLYTQEMIQR